MIGSPQPAKSKRDLQFGLDITSKHSTFLRQNSQTSHQHTNLQSTNQHPNKTNIKNITNKVPQPIPIMMRAWPRQVSATIGGQQQPTEHAEGAKETQPSRGWDQ